VTAGFFNPSNGNEAYFFDVIFNGVQATAADVADVVGIINSSEDLNATVAYMVADGNLSLVNPFPSNYNLLLYFSTAQLASLGVTDDPYLGLNLSDFPGYESIGVDIVPEPASPGLLALGSLGILRRPRRTRN
jgi:PEP-CTERM motif